jgi:hypothetical protein
VSRPCRDAGSDSSGLQHPNGPQPRFYGLLCGDCLYARHSNIWQKEGMSAGPPKNLALRPFLPYASLASSLPTAWLAPGYVILRNNGIVRL